MCYLHVTTLSKQFHGGKLRENVNWKYFPTNALRKSSMPTQTVVSFNLRPSRLIGSPK